MSGKLPGLRKRLAKVEQKLVDIAKRGELANCICRELTVAHHNKPEEFEAEMNQTCPVHGFRRLGRIIHVEFVGKESAKLNQLLETYRARQLPRKLRLSQLRQVGLELKHGSEEP